MCVVGELWRELLESERAVGERGGGDVCVCESGFGKADVQL